MLKSQLLALRVPGTENAVPQVWQTEPAACTGRTATNEILVNSRILPGCGPNPTQPRPSQTDRTGEHRYIGGPTLRAEDRRDIFRESATKRGIGPAIVEKDCWVLKNLFSEPTLKDSLNRCPKLRCSASSRIAAWPSSHIPSQQNKKTISGRENESSL